MGKIEIEGECPRTGSAHSAWQYRHGSNSSILLILRSAIRARASVTPQTKTERGSSLSSCCNPLFWRLFCGAQGRNRTTDTVIFSHVLYQLSYLGGKRGITDRARPRLIVKPRATGKRLSMSPKTKQFHQAGAAITPTNGCLSAAAFTAPRVECAGPPPPPVPDHHPHLRLRRRRQSHSGQTTSAKGRHPRIVVSRTAGRPAPKAICRSGKAALCVPFRLQAAFQPIPHAHA